MRAAVGALEAVMAEVGDLGQLPVAQRQEAAELVAGVHRLAEAAMVATVHGVLNPSAVALSGDREGSIASRCGMRDEG